MIYHSNKDYGIVDASGYGIFLYKGYGECALLNWDGINLIAEMDSENFTEQSFFYGDEFWSLRSEDDEPELIKFSQETGVQSVLRGNFDEEYAKKLLVYKNRLYILTKIYDCNTPFGFDKRQIYSVNLDSPTQFEIVREKFLTYDGHSVMGGAPLLSLENGWVFVEDRTKYSHEFNLNFFSCETEEEVTLAKGCGSYKVKKHLFGEDDIFHNISSLKAIGNYVVFKLGSPYSSNGRAMVSIYEPMNVKLLS